jgi:hypothetical protein
MQHLLYHRNVGFKCLQRLQNIISRFIYVYYFMKMLETS